MTSTERTVLAILTLLIAIPCCIYWVGYWWHPLGRRLDDAYDRHLDRVVRRSRRH